jgi:hypothetical protein
MAAKTSSAAVLALYEGGAARRTAETEVRHEPLERHAGAIYTMGGFRPAQMISCVIFVACRFFSNGVSHAPSHLYLSRFSHDL